MNTPKKRLSILVAILFFVATICEVTIISYENADNNVIMAFFKYSLCLSVFLSHSPNFKAKLTEQEKILRLRTQMDEKGYHAVIIRNLSI